jgi:hypothetical protein
VGSISPLPNGLPVALTGRRYHTDRPRSQETGPSKPRKRNRPKKYELASWKNITGRAKERLVCWERFRRTHSLQGIQDRWTDVWKENEARI